jgi:hypothetical protein
MKFISSKYIPIFLSVLRMQNIWPLVELLHRNPRWWSPVNYLKYLMVGSFVVRYIISPLHFSTLIFSCSGIIERLKCVLNDFPSAFSTSGFTGWILSVLNSDCVNCWERLLGHFERTAHKTVQRHLAANFVSFV